MDGDHVEIGIEYPANIAVNMGNLTQDFLRVAADRGEIAFLELLIKISPEPIYIVAIDPYPDNVNT